jgi:hypothetical protein
MCLHGSEDWLYCASFPEAKSRDFADLWPPDAIVSEMTSTSFTDVEAERRHVHRERDLAELWSAVGSASGTHNCCHHRDAAYKGGLAPIERDLDDPQTPRTRAPTTVLVSVGGDTVSSRRSVRNIRSGAAARLEDDSRRPRVRAVSAAEGFLR